MTPYTYGRYILYTDHKRILEERRPKMPKSCGECPVVDPKCVAHKGALCRSALWNHYTKGDT